MWQNEISSRSRYSIESTIKPGAMFSDVSTTSSNKGKGDEDYCVLAGSNDVAH